MIHFHVMRVYNLPITALIWSMYPTIFFSPPIWKFQFTLSQPSSLANSFSSVLSVLCQQYGNYSIESIPGRKLINWSKLYRSCLVLLNGRLHRQVPQGRRRLAARRDLRLGSAKHRNCFIVPHRWRKYGPLYRVIHLSPGLGWLVF